MFDGFIIPYVDAIQLNAEKKLKFIKKEDKMSTKLYYFDDFKKEFDLFQSEVHRNAVAHGFWESDRSTGESIALMHSELSEALEADRKKTMDDHLPEYDGVTVELADCIIRIMDYAERNCLPLAQAIIDKHGYNATRPYKHGKAY